MKRGVWFGSAILSLGGCLGGLTAQEAPRQPEPVNLTGAELRSVPIAVSVSIGRPVPIASTRPTPPESVTPVVYQPKDEAERLPPLTAPVPPTLPTWPEEAQRTIDNAGALEQASVFAAERPPPIPLPLDGLRPTVMRLPDLEQPPTPRKAPDKPPATLPAAAIPGPLVHAVDGPLPDPLSCHYYGRIEYLLWGVKGYKIPPLVTTGTAPEQGIIGQNTTQILFGNSELADGLRSGIRGRLGWWFDMWCEEGFEIGGFFVGEKNDRFTASSDQFPVLSRPFFDLNNNRESVERVAFPGIATATISINSPSRFFGAEANYIKKLCCGCDYRSDLILGFRYLNLDESLIISEDIQAGAAAPAPFTNQHVTVFDRFTTRNQFIGPQVGVSCERHWGKWYLEGRAQLALGATSQEIEIDGAEFLAPTPVANQPPGGLLALQSNIGHHSKTRFSVVPEVNLNVGYQINDHLRAFVGYDVLFCSSVVRPGDQIDRTLDIATIPNFNSGLTPTGQNRPAVPFVDRAFWAQGVNIGLEWRY